MLERAGDIGGTWRDNTYPGIAVDIPAQAYQFSYELNPDWSRVFARGAEVKQYIDQCADRYDVRRFVRLNSEVLSRSWDEQAQSLAPAVPDGELTARFVISAVGAFVNPKPAQIDGLERLPGRRSLHSAAWDHSVELAGKRVAVIGTGASAVQIIPEIAPTVGPARRLPADADLGRTEIRPTHAARGAVALPPVPASPATRCGPA